MLTVRQAIDLMEHGAGAAPDSRHNLYQTLNRAGRFLCAYSGWSWTVAGPVYLATAADSRFVRLPDDFRQLIAITAPGSAFGIAQIDQVRMMRLHSASAGGHGRWYITVPPHFTPSPSAPLPVKEAMVFPTPETSDARAFELLYTREWANIADDGSDDDRQLPLPDQFENAIIMLARAYTLDLQDQAESHEMARAMSELALLKSQDAANQPMHGPITGGAASRRARYRPDSHPLGPITL